MGLIKDLAEVWRKQLDSKRAQKNKYRIEYAFSSGGTKYYQFADITNLPYERGLTALQVYNEVEMRCSVDFLKQYTKAVDEILTNGKQIDIFALKGLNEMLKQRLSLSVNVDLLYKLASVVYFDKTENPAVYEQDYAAKKIAKWRKDKGVNDFFMQKPLKELMPFLTNVGSDLQAYSDLTAELEQIHFELLRICGSTNEESNTMNGKK